MNGHRRALRVLRWLVGVVLVSAVGVSALITGLGLSGQVRLRAELTGSMAPRIDVGDLVVYRPERARDARPGQVISFDRPGVPYPITHRILQMSLTDGGVTMVTKGDANPSVDPVNGAFPSAQTVWRVWKVIPGAGQLVSELTGRRGVIFILSFLPLFFGLPWLERQFRDYESPTATTSAGAGLLSVAPTGGTPS